MENNIKLLNYQKHIKNFIINHKNCGIFLQMGMGKTLSALSALMEIKHKNHVLIIAPKNIAKSVWIDEIHKWNLPIRYKSFIINDNGKELSKNKRHELYKSVVNAPTTMYFINNDLLEDLVNNLPVINGKKTWYFQTVVIDEFQSFKSWESNRFKCLSKVRPCIDRLIGMSGTPTPNGLIDLWSQVYLLDGGKRLGKTIEEYRSTFFFEGRRLPNGILPRNAYIPKEGAKEEIYRRIKDVCVSMENTNIKLPELVYNDIKIYMNDHQKKIYNSFKENLKVLTDAKNKIIAKNTQVLLNKLAQMASGGIYVPEWSKNCNKPSKYCNRYYETIHEEKLNMVERILNNTDSNIMIAYCYQSDLDMLVNMLEKKKFKYELFDGSSEQKYRWNHKEIKVLLFQPYANAHGHNLQDGGNVLIWYTLPFDYEKYSQTNARLHRMGQKEQNVIIHRLLCVDTIDEVKPNILERKFKDQKELLNAVKHLIPSEIKIVA